MSELVEPQVVKQARRATATSRVMTVVLEGEIGLGEAGDVTAMLRRLLVKGVTQVVVDLSEVSHFDYRGVRPLMREAEALRERGGELCLAGLSPYLHAIFRSAGAHEAFDYFADAADACRALEGDLPLQAG